MRIFVDGTQKRAESIEAMRRAVSAHVEDMAKSKGYDDTKSLATYRDSTITDWAAEAQAFIYWRDQVWLFVITRLQNIEDGTAQPPVSVAAFIAELPEMEWPS